MARLTANVVLPGENGEVVTLLHGTEAPEWALPFLGAHVLDESEQAPAPDEDEDDGSDDTEDVEDDESDDATDDASDKSDESTDETADESEQAPAPAKPRRR